MIRILAVNSAPIFDCSKDDGKTLVETASDQMAMGAVLALFEFSLLGSQQNHSDSTRRGMEAISQEAGFLSRSENDEVCEHQCE